jgi:hypothetical protein
LGAGQDPLQQAGSGIDATEVAALAGPSPEQQREQGAKLVLERGRPGLE